MKVDTLLHYYENVPYPVFLVIIDTTNNKSYWLFIQEYINNLLNKEDKWKKQKTKTIYIPKKNNFELDYEIIEETAQKGRIYCSLILDDNMNLEYRKKVKNIEDNPKEIENMINNLENNLFMERINISINYLEKDNNLNACIKNLKSNIQKTKDDINNLEVYLKSLMFYISLIKKDNHEYIIKLAEEGKKASKNNFNDIHHYFIATSLEQQFYIQMKNNPNDLEKLKIINQKFYNSLQVILEENIILFPDLVFMFIEMKIFNYYNLIPYYKKEDLKPLNDDIETYISILSTFSEAFDNFYSKFYLLKAKCDYYYYSENEKLNETVNELIKISKVKNKAYYESLAKESKRNYENNPISKLRNPKYSDEEIDKYYRNLIERDGIDLNSDNPFSFALRIGLKDRNPERIIKNCSNIELVITSQGRPAKIYKLPSAGFKLLFCKYKDNAYIEGFILDNIYKDFKKDFCSNCDHCSPQPTDWKWSYEWQIEKDSHMSKELKSILKERNRLVL